MELLNKMMLLLIAIGVMAGCKDNNNNQSINDVKIITEDRNEYGIFAGATLVASFKSSGIKEPIIQWKTNDEEIIGSEKKYQVSNDNWLKDIRLCIASEDQSQTKCSPSETVIARHPTALAEGSNYTVISQ